MTVGVSEDAKTAQISREKKGSKKNIPLSLRTLTLAVLPIPTVVASPLVPAPGNKARQLVV